MSYQTCDKECNRSECNRISVLQYPKLDHSSLVFSQKSGSSWPGVKACPFCYVMDSIVSSLVIIRIKVNVSTMCFIHQV